MVPERSPRANADPCGFSRPEPDPDEYIPFAMVPDTARPRAGKRIHAATIFRWASKGCRGVKLRYVQAGGTRCTTRRWIAEFFDELTRHSQDGDASSPTPETSRPAGIRTAAERRRAAEAADRELARLGV